MPDDLTDEFFEHGLRTISDIGFRRTMFVVQLAGKYRVIQKSVPHLF